MPLTPEQRVEFLQVFALYDRKNEGQIQKKHLKNTFESLGVTLTNEQLRDLLSHADVTGSTISRDQYLEIMQQHLKDTSSLDFMNLCYRQFDTDGNGFLSISELERMQVHTGDAFTAEQFKAMVNFADTDETGIVNHQEFVTLLRRK
eukprot:c5874_g1_i1.p2 GENE.c5874_g1_i1~~c5874_g1_i1.p2  ORF type:complete len:147 (-),score=43.63 c5874_g1_i1:89-529(-)